MRTAQERPARPARRSHAFRLLALLPVAALVAACSSSDSDGDSGSSGSGDSGAVPSALTSYFPGTKATGAEITIGLYNPEGGQVVNQPENREAAQAAVDYANDNLGGIGGHKVKLFVCKGTEDPANALDCANQFVQNKVAAVVSATTAYGAVMAPVVTGAKIPWVTISGSAGAELAAPYAYTWAGGFPGTLIAMSKYAKSKNYSKVSILVVASAEAATKQLGGAIFGAAGVQTNIVAIPKGKADLSAESQAALGSDPGAVAVIADATGCTAAIGALGAAATDAEQLLIQPCLDPSTVQAVGQYMEGQKVFTPSDVFTDEPESQLFRYIVNKYSPDTATEGYAVVGYVGVLGLIRATQSIAAGSEVTSETINTAIKTAKDVALPAGDGLTFTCDGTALAAFKLTSVCGAGSLIGTYEDGKLADIQVEK
jgi:branched-chain amino acid transport system substrate-binding protein